MDADHAMSAEPRDQSLRLDEVCLEIHPGFVVLRISPPGSAVFLELPPFCNEDVRNLDELSFGDGIACPCCVVYDSLSLV